MSVRVKIPFSVRSFRPDDEGQVLELQKQSLGESWVLQRTPTLWRWKHYSNPFGPSYIKVACNEDGQIIGLRAFMQWEFKACGRQIKAARAVDTATHPDYQRQGIFSNLTQCLADAVTKDGLDLIFNTPNKRVLPGYLKLGWRYATNIHPLIKVLNYPVFILGLARYTLQRSRQQHPPEAFFHLEATPFREHMERREEIHDLLAQQERLEQVRHSISTRLSWDYLNWRYVNHPTIAYWSLVAENAGSIQGCLVFRTNTRFGLKEVVVGELFLVRQDQELADSLLNQLQAIIRADYLIAHFAQGSFQHRALKQWGFRTLQRNGIDFTVKTLSPNLPLQPEIFENWNLSLGDLEYF